MKKIGEIMTTPVVTIPPGKTLGDAVALMAERRLSCVVLEQGMRPVGLLNEARAVVLAAEGAGMDKSLDSCGLGIDFFFRPDQSLVEAVTTMEKSGESAVVVCNPEGRLQGIVTLTDVIKRADDSDFMARQKVKYSMTKNFIMVSEVDTVGDCMSRMSEMKLDSVIVTAQKAGVGIFTLRDAVSALGSVNGESVLNEPVYKFMTPSLITVNAEDFLMDACRIMSEKGIRRLVVVDSRNTPRGIISQRELLKRLDTNYSELMSKALSQNQNYQRMVESGFLTVADSSFEPVLIVRGEEIIHANLAMLEALRYGSDELAGKNIFELIFHEDLSVFEKDLSAKTEGIELEHPIYTRVVAEGGQKLYLEFRARRLYEDSKPVTWFFGRDVTEQKEREIELIRLRKKAEEASRMKSAFLANVSHELRTPLTAIIGFGKLMCDNHDLPEATRKQSGIVLRQGKHLLSLINRILEISQAEKKDGGPVFNRVLLKDVIDVAVDKQKQFAQSRNVTVTVNRSPDLPGIVEIDAEKLALALEQLLDNAIKFSKSEGEVEIAAMPHGDMILFRVTDKGIGIEKEMFENIFADFFQVDGSINREYGGAGLGLPLAKLMVLGMGGEIWVESTKGEMTSFFFTAPFRYVGKV